MMPFVKVRVFAILRELMGTRSLDVDAPVEDVGALIQFLAEGFQPSFKEALLDQKGQVRRGFSILVNGRDIAFLEGLRTKLKDGDTIALFPPVAGG